MTMTREAKNLHEAELKRAASTGYAVREFQSPKLRTAAKATRGHAHMTSAEYREHAMHRGVAHECRVQMHIERRQQAHRGARILGGRRINAKR